jgi:hypothetical protein
LPQDAATALAGSKKHFLNKPVLSGQSCCTTKWQLVPKCSTTAEFERVIQVDAYYPVILRQAVM